MSSIKPALVVVPGACHHQSQYEPLSSRLHKAGYEVTTVDNPSTGGSKPLRTLSADIHAIQQAIVSYLDRDQNVTLIFHSFGGITGSAAVQGLTPSERNGGPGIVKLIYLCAFVCPEGQSALDSAGGQHAPSVQYPLPEPENAGFCSFYNPAETFYNECTPHVKEANVKKLRLFSEGICHDIVPYAGWKHVDSYYLQCAKDNVLPVFVQEMWSSSPGGRWKKVERMETDHSPYLSRPDETAEFVLRCIEDGS